MSDCFVTSWTVACQAPLSVHGISQVKILKWVAISFSRGSSWPRDLTCVSRIVGGFFTTESPGKPLLLNIVRIKIPPLILVSENSPKYVMCRNPQNRRYFFNVSIILDSVFKHMYPWFCIAYITLNIIKWKSNTSTKRSTNINNNYNSSTEWVK